MKSIKDLKLQETTKISEMTQGDMKKEVVDAQKKMYVLQMKKSAGELKQTHMLKALRRYVAKLKTFASQKGFRVD